MKRNQVTVRNGLPAYCIAFVSAAVSMAQGGVWVSLIIFGLSILAAVAVEVYKRT
jgi:hypothetical protein